MTCAPCRECAAVKRENAERAKQPESLRASVLWVIFTAVTWSAVLIAATAPRWDTTLSACAICFARGRWTRTVR